MSRTRRTGEDHQVVLTRFALGRFLYRLGQLPERDDFTLKGAVAFLVWEGKLGRQTRDLNLLGHGPSSADRLRNILVKACQADVGSGDAVVPSAERKVCPGLLDFPEPELKTYPPETVVAEKVHGMVRIG